MAKHLIKTLLCVCLLVLPLERGTCEAAGLSYADNQVFSHGYIDFEEAGPLVMPDYPFASVGKKMVFQTSYRSLYNMKELTDNRAAFAMTRGRYNGGIAFATFGEPDYFHQWGLSAFVSYRRNRFSLGGAIIYSRMSFSDKYDNVSSMTTNLGIAYSRDNITAFALTRSFNQPKYYTGGTSIMPEAEIGVSYKSRQGLDSQAKTLFIRHQKPTAELSQSLRLSEYASINWALVLLPARFGGGLSLEKGRFVFDYKISHHPVLGATHTIILTMNKTDNQSAKE